jgi:hypothetical protein
MIIALILTDKDHWKDVYQKILWNEDPEKIDALVLNEPLETLPRTPVFEKDESLEEISSSPSIGKIYLVNIPGAVRFPQCEKVIVSHAWLKDEEQFSQIREKVERQWNGRTEEGFQWRYFQAPFSGWNTSYPKYKGFGIDQIEAAQKKLLQNENAIVFSQSPKNEIPEAALVLQWVVQSSNKLNLYVTCMQKNEETQLFYTQFLKKMAHLVQKNPGTCTIFYPS